MFSSIFKFVLDFIPIKYLKLILVALVFLIGLFSGYRLTSWYYYSKVSDLKGQVQQYEFAYKHLADTTSRQSLSILELQEKTKKKDNEIKIAQEKVKKESNNYKKKASELLQLSSEGKSCKDASELIDTELRLDRNINE